MDVGPNLLLRHKNELDINIELPLHARYPVCDKGIKNCEKINWIVSDPFFDNLALPMYDVSESVS